jgi:hypothetical protein
VSTEHQCSPDFVGLQLAASVRDAEATDGVILRTQNKVVNTNENDSHQYY